MGQYVNAMAFSLYEWDKEHGSGGNLGWDYYYAMGWGGLTQYAVFDEIIQDIDTRAEITQIINDERESNVYSNGTKCN